jgi:hypothetical protein
MTNRSVTANKLQVFLSMIRYLPLPQGLIQELSTYGFIVILLDLARFLSFLILHTVGRAPWTGDQARPLPTHRNIQTQNKRPQTFVPWVKFRTTIPAFEQAKRVHALACAAAVIGDSGTDFCGTFSGDTVYTFDCIFLYRLKDFLLHQKPISIQFVWCLYNH